MIPGMIFRGFSHALDRSDAGPMRYHDCYALKYNTRQLKL